MARSDGEWQKLDPARHTYAAAEAGCRDATELCEEATMAESRKYGFRYDPMAFVEGSDSLEAAPSRASCRRKETKMLSKTQWLALPTVCRKETRNG